MRGLDDIDSAHQLFSQMGSDPGFYVAKAYLRECWPDAWLIEIVPAQCRMANVVMVHDGGTRTEVMI